MRPELIYLRISSYRGISIGATHWYAKLLSSDHKKEPVELTHALSQKEIDSLLDKNDGYTCWKAGEQYSGFWTEEEIPIIAKKIWRNKFPQAFALIQGDPGYHEPHKVIDGGELFDFATATNAIHEAWEKLGWNPWGEATKEYAYKIHRIWEKWEKAWLKVYKNHMKKQNC